MASGSGDSCMAKTLEQLKSDSESQLQDEEEEEPTFLEQPQPRYYCLICHSVMRDPHIVMCCCKKMCGGCIERVHHSGQPCPNCRKPDFVMYPERDLNSEILDLKVRCTHHTNGCEWVGELRDLKKHTDPEKGSCGFIPVKCPYGCPVAYLRHESDNHESVCTNLPPELQIKRTMRATDQFKEELQVTLDQFQELYKSESKRVRELTDQLETMKENHKKEEQKMKHQFEAEKKQLLDECRTEYQQQIKLQTESLREEFTQEMNKMKKKSEENQRQMKKSEEEYLQQMKKNEEEHQQQMVSLKQHFEKEEKERSEAAKKQLAELKEYYQKELKKNENENKQQRETPQHTETNIEESKVFTGLSKDVLLLISKVNEDRFKMMQFFPEEGKVVVLATSEEEQEKCIQQFQEMYQDIIKNRQLKTGDLEVPASFPMEKMFSLLDEFNDKYNQCHFSCDEKARVIRIVSMSSRQFDQAKRLMADRLHTVGEERNSKTSKKKGGKGGDKGGKGAFEIILTKNGSSGGGSSAGGGSVSAVRGGGREAGSLGGGGLGTAGGAIRGGELPFGIGASILRGEMKFSTKGAIAQNEKTEGRPICLNKELTKPYASPCCKQLFCKSCFTTALRNVQGNQPVGGKMTSYVTHTSLPGYEGAGTIVIKYTIPSGTQTTEHPSPGKYYYGTSHTAYLPNTPEGQEILKLLKKAFDARLIFTVGTSHTTGQTDTVVWNDIHHKTGTHGQPYGYPDPTYLARVREELKAKGIE